jgi:hypothetical protein
MEVVNRKSPLPVDVLLLEIISSLQRNPNLVVEAPPGAGKTTRVPPALLGIVAGEVVVLEPRRINLLASGGYKAEGYSSAEEFLESGGLQKSSCVITDVEMGQISGLGLLHHINSTASN